MVDNICNVPTVRTCRIYRLDKKKVIGGDYMKNSQILINLDRCMKTLNQVIVEGYNDKWDDRTLDALECIIDSLNFNYEEMKKNNERMDV